MANGDLHDLRRKATGGEPRGDYQHFVGQLLGAVLIVLAASGVAVWLFHGVQVQDVLVLFLVAVLLAAVLYGLAIGLISIVFAAAAFLFFIGKPAFLAQISTWQDAVPVALFMAGVWAAGLYTDRLKAARRVERPLSDTSDGPSGWWRAAEPSSGAPGGRIHGWLRMEAARAGAMLVAIASAGYLAWLLPSDLAGAGQALLLLATVVGVATALGARFGLAAGVLGMLALNHLLTLPPNGAPVSLAMMLLQFAIFSGVGWWVGREADRLQGERRALEVMVSAGRELAVTTNEADIRNALFNSLVRINPHGSTRLVDENDVVTHEELRAGTPIQSRTWRTQRMSADGRALGALHWTGDGVGRSHAIRDEVICALVDIGASAIVRTRLGVEKADMEFVARTEQLRTILLDAVSHHFRTPLAGIIGSVTSILNLPEPHDRAARRDLLLIIKEQANRLHRYVENFLAVARLESGSIDPKLETITVEPLIYDVWETFGEAGGARRFLHVKIDQEPVLADAGLLAQIFGNVLENAIKFSPEGSVVDVRTRKDGQRLVFEISDQGCGVPQEAASKIFERFYRSRESIAPGLGLGLYITRSLVEKLGGEVEARNRKDAMGLVVSIALPMARAA